jgi:hypothetical protein
MGFTRCKKCNDYHWENESCKPVFLVYHEDWSGEKALKYHANTFEEAAELHGIRYNDGDHRLLDDEIKIEIENIKGVKKRFKVSAEPAINYNIEEI